MIPLSATRQLQGLTLALVTVGYAFFAAFSEFFGFPSTPMAIGARAAAGALCVFLWLAGARQRKGERSFWFLACATLFWILYLIRMAYDTYWYGNLLIYEPALYWLWGIGGCFVPMLALAGPQYRADNSFNLFRWCLFFGFCACLLAWTSLSTMVETEYGSYSSGRASLDTLNPISLGHLGVQIIILSIWRMFLAPSVPSAKGVAALVAALALGGFIMLSANSRGPLVALVVTLLFALAASNYHRKYMIAALLALIAAVFASLARFIDEAIGTNIYDRILGQSQMDDVNTRSRFDLFDSAASQFLDRPLFGYGLEDPVFGGYPHNLVVEAFMATGIFGGILFIIMLVLAVVSCRQILRRRPQYGWVALLLVQQIVAVQFSGSLAQSTILWALFGVAASISAAAKPAADVPGEHGKLRTNVSTWSAA